MLIKNKARIDAEDLWGNTPLKWACTSGFPAVARYLALSGARVDKVLYDFEDRCHVPARDLKYSGGEPIRVKKKMNALLEVAAGMSESVFGVVLTLYPPTLLRSHKFNGGRSFFHQAVGLQNEHNVRLLLDKPFSLDVNAIDEDGNTPLHLAAGYRKGLMLQILLEQPGIDLNRLNKFGNTPLMLAIYDADYKMIKTLSQEHSVPSPEPNSAQPFGPIHVAARAGNDSGRLKLLRFLVHELKFDPNGRTFGHERDLPSPGHRHSNHHPSCRQTPLCLSLKDHHPKVVEFFIEECNIDPGVSCRDCDGALPLHVAAEADRVDIVEALIQRWGADIHVRDKLQQTPLHALAWATADPVDTSSTRDFPRSTLRILLEAGVQISAKNCRGLTARDILLGWAAVADRHYYVGAFDQVVQQWLESPLGNFI